MRLAHPLVSLAGNADDWRVTNVKQTVGSVLCRYRRGGLFLRRHVGTRDRARRGWGNVGKGTEDRAAWVNSGAMSNIFAHGFESIGRLVANRRRIGIVKSYALHWNADVGEQSSGSLTKWRRAPGLASVWWRSMAASCCDE